MNKVDIHAPKVSYENGKAKLVGDVSYDQAPVKAKISLDVEVDAAPIVDKVLDEVGKKIDELIPGDQSLLIEGIKASVKKALEHL